MLFNKVPSKRIQLFLKTEIFSSVLAFLPHVNGVFGYQKRSFSKTVPRVECFENARLWFCVDE